MKRNYTVLLVLFSTCMLNISSLFPDENKQEKINQYDKNEIQEICIRDAYCADIYRKGFTDIFAFIKSHSEIFPQRKKASLRTYNREEKEIVWSTWQSFLDYIYAEESIIQFYSEFGKVKDDNARKNSFRVYYSVFLTQYRYALDFINMAENDEALDIILNDEVPEYGIRSDSYSGFKTKFLHLQKGASLMAGAMINKTYGNGTNAKINTQIDEDQTYIIKLGKLRDMAMTFENAGTMIKENSAKLFFPIQAKFAEWAGDTKVKRIHSSLISQKQIKNEIVPVLKPGDILLERREWYLSNVGLPGFWPHGALYIGTKDERERYFTNDSEIEKWVISLGETSGNFENLLRKLNPKAYSQLISNDEFGHSYRIIEAMSEGVVFTSAEHSAEADSLGVIRPIMTKKLKAEVILRSLHFWGRPYDFNFDFLTDSSIVCTELLVKCMEKRISSPGIIFTYSNTLGRKVVSANDIVRQFDAQYGTTRSQFEFVLFFDGYEKGKHAVKSDLASFRSSWARPKWDIFVQKALE